MLSNEELVRYLERYGYLKREHIKRAFLEVDRKNFIPKNLESYAYIDEPLPIGYGQTISAPSIVAMMTEALDPKEGQKILEIGAGSGYQAAILSKIVGEKGKVIAVERIPELANFAKSNLKEYKNVKVIVGDGTEGYEEESPYDRIIVTACAPEIPKPLIEQLKEGGIMVIPIGGNVMFQKLYKVIKTKEDLKKEFLEYVAFVPLVGKFGF